MKDFDRFPHHGVRHHRERLQEEVLKRNPAMSVGSSGDGEITLKFANATAHARKYRIKSGWRLEICQDGAKRQTHCPPTICDVIEKLTPHLVSRATSKARYTAADTLLTRTSNGKPAPFGFTSDSFHTRNVSGLTAPAQCTFHPCRNSALDSRSPSAGLESVGVSRADFVDQSIEELVKRLGHYQYRRPGAEVDFHQNEILHRSGRPRGRSSAR